MFIQVEKTIDYKKLILLSFWLGDFWLFR